MNKKMRVAMMGLTALVVLLQACNLATVATPTQAPLPQSQTIAVQEPPTAEPVQEQAPVPQEPAQAASASLEGLVWEDLDRDGLQDVKERGIPNVTVNLLTSARLLAGTATTNQNGAYRFKDLAPGDYFVSMILPAGYVFSPKDQGQNELVDSDSDPATTETLPVTLVAGENGLVFTTGIYSPTAVARPDPGTVQPPPSDIRVCAAGVYPLGGVSTISVSQLAPDYCLEAFLWSHGFAIGRIPGGVGRILSEVTFVEFFYQNTFVYKYDVPSQRDSIQVCYAVPQGREAQIYFFDHYGPRFGQPHQGQPSWTQLPTTVQNGIACAVSQTSGAYALIGK